MRRLPVRHLPNLICLIRLLLIWPIAVALHKGQYLSALVLFIVAAVSDGLDGYLAKRFGWTSEVGKFLDPVADKLLLMTVFVQQHQRDEQQLRGRPTLMSKVNTAAQLLFVALVLLNAASGVPPLEVLAACALITFATTTLSGLHYLLTFTRRAWHAPVSSA